MRDDALADYAHHAAVHAENPQYGAFGDRWAKDVRALAKAIEAQTVLDYGCGKGLLKPALLGLDVREYDPGRPGLDAVPDPADLVVCTDVLPFTADRLDAVLADLKRCAVKALFIIVPRHPDNRLVPHSVLWKHREPLSWWEAKLASVWPAGKNTRIKGMVPRLRFVWQS